MKDTVAVIHQAIKVLDQEGYKTFIRRNLEIEVDDVDSVTNFKRGRYLIKINKYDSKHVHIEVSNLETQEKVQRVECIDNCMNIEVFKLLITTSIRQVNHNKEEDPLAIKPIELEGFINKVRRYLTDLLAKEKAIRAGRVIVLTKKDAVIMYNHDKCKIILTDTDTGIHVLMMATICGEVTLFSTTIYENLHDLREMSSMFRGVIQSSLKLTDMYSKDKTNL